MNHTGQVRVAHTKALAQASPSAIPLAQEMQGAGLTGSDPPWSTLGARLRKKTGTHSQGGLGLSQWFALEETRNRVSPRFRGRLQS